MIARQLDFYLLNRTLRPVSAAVAIALIALLLERLVRLLDLTLNKGGPLTIVLKMLANLVPHYLGIALPAAFFFGVLLAFHRLNQDCEMDALQSAGVNPWRLLTPVIALGVVLSLVAFVVMGYLQPHTRYAYRALVFSLSNSSLNASLDRGTFFTGFDGRTIIVDDISNGGKNLAGVFVFEEGPTGATTMTTATKGQVYREPGELRLILRLENGVWIDSEPDSDSSILSFQQIDLPLDIFTEDDGFRGRGVPESRGEDAGTGTDSTAKPSGSAARELTLPELWSTTQNRDPQTYHPRFTAEFHARLVRIVSIIALPFLAASLGLGSRRSPRNFRLLAGVVVLIFYHHLIQLGQDLIAGSQMTPFWALWAPFIAFAALSLMSFVYATGLWRSLLPVRTAPTGPAS